MDKHGGNDASMERASRLVGLQNAHIPESGTEGMVRLKSLCQEYSSLVSIEMGETFGNVSTFRGNETNRMDLHDRICTILYGTSWKDTSELDAAKAGQFALVVSCRDYHDPGSF